MPRFSPPKAWFYLKRQRDRVRALTNAEDTDAGNLLPDGTDFSTGWTAWNGTIEADATTLAGKSAAKLVEDSTTNFHGAYREITKPAAEIGNYRFSATVEAAGRTDVYIQTGNPAYGFAIYDLATGEVSYTEGTAYLDSSITEIASGVYRITLDAVSNADATFYFTLGIASGISRNYQGDGTSGIYATAARVELIA